MRPYGNRSVGPRSILPAYQPQTGRGVQRYALRQGLGQGRSVAMRLLLQISRIGGCIAMRPYGNRSGFVRYALQPVTHPRRFSIGWAAFNPRCMGAQINRSITIRAYSHAPYGLRVFREARVRRWA